MLGGGEGKDASAEVTMRPKRGVKERKRSAGQARGQTRKGGRAWQRGGREGVEAGRKNDTNENQEENGRVRGPGVRRQEEIVRTFGWDQQRCRLPLRVSKVAQTLRRHLI